MFLKQKFAIHFLEKPQFKIIDFKRENDWYFMHSWLDNVYKGTVVNLIFHYIKRINKNYLYSPFNGRKISLFFSPLSYCDEISLHIFVWKFNASNRGNFKLLFLSHKNCLKSINFQNFFISAYSKFWSRR